MLAEDEHGKSWISVGGGAWILDPWLVYAVSFLQHGQPRGAVHSVDMALRSWITDPYDRPILYWVRAAVIHRRLRDPKTALADYESAAFSPPAWLREQVLADWEACKADAAHSRKRKPSVKPAPETFSTEAHDIVAPPQDNRPPPGTIPAVWDALLQQLQKT